MSEGRAQKDTFSAWIDRMPGSANKLHVAGKVEYGSGGLKPTLVKVIPQGINPAILMLEVADEKDGDVGTKPILLKDAKYEDASGNGVKQVSIRSASPEFTVDVKDVH